MNYLNKFKLHNQTAFVCGGLGLIGIEVSTALAQAGAKVIILDINTTKWNELARYLSYDMDISFFKFNTTNPRTYRKTLKKVFNEHGYPSIFINMGYPKTKDWGNKLEDINILSWQKNVNLQLNSYCLLTKEVASFMKERKISGCIINYGSTYGVVAPDFSIYDGTGMTCPAAYSAIKGGIINFTRYIASYYGKYGIRVNCICPGGVYNKQPKAFVEKYNKKTLLGRMAKPEEIASATLFLASEASSYITGSILMVDGGWTAI